MKTKRNVKRVLILSEADAKKAIAGHFVGYLTDDPKETEKMIETGEIFHGALPDLSNASPAELHRILWNESSITDYISENNSDCELLMVEGCDRIILLTD
jgi:hypothetical protein